MEKIKTKLAKRIKRYSLGDGYHYYSHDESGKWLKKEIELFFYRKGVDAKIIEHPINGNYDNGVILAITWNYQWDMDTVTIKAILGNREPSKSDDEVLAEIKIKEEKQRKILEEQLEWPNNRDKRIKKASKPNWKKAKEIFGLKKPSYYDGIGEEIIGK